MSSDDPFDIDDPITAAIDAAEEISDPVAEANDQKPRLLIDNCNPDRTVAALRDILANASALYDRGAPVRLAFNQQQCGTVVLEMTANVLVLLTHEVCRPYVLKT